MQRNAPLSSCEQYYCHLFLSPLVDFFELVIPLLLDDIRRVMQTWGASGKFDPFVNVYEVNIAGPFYLLLPHILTTIHIPALIPAFYPWFVKQRNF